MNNKIKIAVAFAFIYFVSRRKSTEIIDIVDNLPQNPNKQYNKRDESIIDKIILHHFASNGTPEAIANYHINTNDWPAIGYHFVISKDGTIYKTNNLDTISYHVSGYNTNSIGISLEGNFKIEKPKKEQLDSLYLLIKNLKEKYKKNFPVYQHSQFSPTKPYDASLDLTIYND